MVEAIRELEQVEDEQKSLAGGIAYTYSSTVVEKKLEDYLQYIDSAACKVDSIVAWRVDKGGDLYNCLKAKIYTEELYPAVIPTMVGTITKASLGYFLSDKGIFHVNRVTTPTGLEVVSGSGTVGIQEDKVMPHIHIVVADHSGSAYGGHLFPGTVVKEYVEGFLIKLAGVKFERIWSEKARSYPLRFLKA